MSLQIELLSQPGCGPCVVSKAILSQTAQPFIVRNVQEDPEAADLIRESPFSGTPVVSVNGILYHGTDRDAIRQAIANAEVLF